MVDPLYLSVSAEFCYEGLAEHRNSGVAMPIVLPRLADWPESHSNRCGKHAISGPDMLAIGSPRAHKSPCPTATITRRSLESDDQPHRSQPVTLGPARTPTSG